jgi:hypothetical protein
MTIKLETFGPLAAPAWVETLGQALARALDPILDQHLPENSRVIVVIRAPNGEGQAEEITLGNMSTDELADVVAHLQAAETQKLRIN